MKQKLFTILTLLLCLCSTAWADEYELLDHTNKQLTGDFIAKTSWTNDATQHFDGNTFAGYLKFSNNMSSWSKKAAESGYTIDYDIKTTSVTFTFYVGNTSSDTPQLYYVVYDESSDAHSNPDVTQQTIGDAIPKGNTTAQYTTRTVTITRSKNARICFYTSKTSLLVYQIVANETGTALPKVGEAGYSLNMNKGRFALNSSKNGTIDDNIEIVGAYSDYNMANSSQVVITKNAPTTSYIKFKTPATPGAMKLTWSNGQMAMNTSASATGATSVTSGSSYVLNGNTDYYLFSTNTSGNSNVTKLEFVTPPTLYTITYENAEGATGIAPEAKTDIESGTKISLPKNFTMYKEGFTMTGWDADGDGTADYAPGDEYTVNGTATLTAVFTSNNGTTLADRNSAVTVKYEFQRGEGAPTIAWGEGSGAHLWVGQANVNGKTIDVKADINVTASGKMANGNWTDWMQINNTTEITLPSCEGATVNVRVYDSNDASTVNGNARNSISSSIAKYNITSANSTALFVASGSYYKYIEAVLPPTLTAESDRMWDFSNTTDFPDASSADKTYDAETRVQNLLIGNGATLTKDNQRLKLNNKGTATQYFVKIKVAEHSKITVNAVGGSNRNICFAENAVGGTKLSEQACGSTAANYVLSDTGEGDKIICIYNSGSNDGNITLYSIKVEEYVAAAPTTVTIEPSPAAAYKDGTVTLTATADGAPAPTITWYQCDDAEKTNPVEKATGASYKPSTAAAGSFYFYATATNSEGSASSNVVTLTVTDPNKYVEANAYYFTNNESAINGEKIYGNDITVELTGASGGLNNAATEGSVATLDADYVAVVTGKDGSNGWGPTFTPAVNGTVTFGAFFNGNNDRKVTITNVSGFSYQKNGDAAATEIEGTEYTPSAVFRGLVTFDVVAGTSYRVSFSGSKMGFYGFEFVPEKVAVTKRDDRTYGTFVTPKALDFSDVTGMEAYIAKGLNGTSVSIEKVTKVPANTPIIVKTAEKTTASVNVPVTSNATAADVEGNLLVAGDGITEWNGTAGYTYYYLASDQFHKGTSGTLQTGKAYLKVEGDPTSAKAMIINIGEGEATGINAIEEVTPVTKTRKVVKNGRLVIETANGVFTIDGARVK